MRKFLIVLVVMVIVLNFSSYAYAMPNVDGKSYIVIDSQTGQVLFGKDYNKKLYPASTTKILTTILALEKGDLSDKVKIGENVPLVEGTKVYLREGEVVTLEQLLNAAMVHSANDAALAIAEHISGSQEKFANLMNQKAREIGAKNSNFINPHGLTNEKHVTTAYDLALIGRYAMQNPLFRKLAIKKVYDWKGQEWQTRLININRLLWQMADCNGIKSGYTTDAKHTLVASAQRDGRELICVILGSNGTTIWEDAKNLLNYGFNNFKNLTLTKDNEIIATIKISEDKEVKLVPVKSSAITISQDKSVSVEKKLELNDFKLPIKKGQVLGNLVIMLNGNEIKKIPVKSLNKVEKPINWSLLITNILAGLFILQILVRIWRRYLKRKRKKYMYSTRRKITSYRF